MTDRVQNLTVILDSSYRVDDIEPLMDVLRGVKHVSDVLLGHPDDFNTVVAQDRLNHSVVLNLMRVIRLYGRCSNDLEREVLRNIQAELSKLKY